MSRPIKNNCSYFSHDADMRNHRKIKALRTTFKNGYAIWCMVLEYLTSADGNTFEDSEMELELLSGDFGFPTSEIRDVLDYCYKLELLFKNDGFCFSESLNDRLSVVYAKRGRARDISRQQFRINGKFSVNNAVKTELPTSENPQSKVKESKVKESKENIPAFVDFLNYAREKKPRVKIDTLKLKYEAWVVNGWKTGKDKPIKNWKSTLLQTLPHLPENQPDTWHPQ